MCAAKAGLRRFLASPGYTGGTGSSLALTCGRVSFARSAEEKEETHTVRTECLQNIPYTARNFTFKTAISRPTEIHVKAMKVINGQTVQFI